MHGRGPHGGSSSAATARAQQAIGPGRQTPNQRLFSWLRYQLARLLGGALPCSRIVQFMITRTGHFSASPSLVARSLREVALLIIEILALSPAGARQRFSLLFRI